MINGDYSPTRLGSVVEAAGSIANSTIHARHENTIGLISLSYGGRLCITLTDNMAYFNTRLQALKPSGTSNFVQALNLACLCVQNRSNYSHKPRIIVFVGSQIYNSEKELTELYKSVRKNGISLDVINIEPQNTEILDQFMNKFSNDETSHLLHVPPSRNVKEAVHSSEIMVQRPDGSSHFGGDIDDDPDLMMAIRASMMDQQRAQPAPVEEQPPTDDIDDMDEEEQLLMAIQMSLQNNPLPSEELADSQDDDRDIEMEDKSCREDEQQ